jgi:hypothetical protein
MGEKNMKNVMMRVLRGVLLTAAIFLPVYASAATVLAPGATWEYTFTDPTVSPAWATTTGGWSTGLAPFGNNTGGYSSDPLGYFDYKTNWPVGSPNALQDDLWVRKEIDLTGYDLTTVKWDLGVDNGFKLYLNGNLVAQDNTEGFTYRWEYGGNFNPGTLNQGMNVIAVALEDHGGLTAFDMQLTGTAAVPEPFTFLFLGSCLVGAAGAVRKFKS